MPEHGQKDVAGSLIHFRATIFNTELSMCRRLDVGRQLPLVLLLFHGEEDEGRKTKKPGFQGKPGWVIPYFEAASPDGKPPPVILSREARATINLNLASLY